MTSAFTTRCGREGRCCVWAECRCTRGRSTGCPRRRPGWRGPRSRRAAWPCGSGTSWASCSRTRTSPASIRARFPTAACRPCKAREQCTRSNNKSDMGRRITLRPQAEQEVIQQARPQEDTPEWKEQYAHRAGVEGTISQGVGAFGLRQCRYHGLPKARLQHQLTVIAMNFHRPNAWWTDTPTSPDPHIPSCSPPACP
ncbi:transposase [Streptomyces californicus]|uniref:transposase n=1 Tax=Streptomyces californicus TaxID=67351 RepID=UPI0036F52562